MPPRSSDRPFRLEADLPLGHLTLRALLLGREPTAVAVPRPARRPRLERRVLRALLELVRAAWPKVAALGARRKRRRHAADRRQPIGPRQVQPRDRSEQPPGVRMLGVVKDFLEGPLLDHATRVHDEDT